MREIRVLKRSGHELGNDVRACLACLKQAGIAAHKGQDAFDQPGYGVIRGVDDEDEAQALRLLRAKGFDVVAA